MNYLDWIVLSGTLIFIVAYGVWKTTGSTNIEGYLKGDQNLKWWTIGLSVMATQASAITFLSVPGQAYESDMGFVQMYFGLPIAMVILSITFIPIYFKLKVYTAYEYLESRFDLKTRTLTAFIFLIQRGLAAGITIYAPAIILSKILNWPLGVTILIIGVLVIIYTVSGGTKAVSVTQKQQMGVMMGGMIVAFIIVIQLLPEEITFTKALHVAGKMEKLEAVDFSFDITDRYNIWSGMIGGLFLALSYFGTDQSQVSRYLGGKSISQIRTGLLFNGLFKVPMQFFILLVGIMVFIFYQFYMPPLFFNDAAQQNVRESEYAEAYADLEAEQQQLFTEKKAHIHEMVRQLDNNDPDITQTQQHILALDAQNNDIRERAGKLIKAADEDAEVKDTDYVFITFVINHLPHGVIGLLLAVIFSGAMSSTASELNALASTTTVDIFKRSVVKNGSERYFLNASKLFTLLWGIIAIIFAIFASLAENLIEFVNMLGSIFYGTILGVFLCAFYVKYVKANAVFIAAVVTEAIIIYLSIKSEISYLLYNAIGCILVILIALVLQYTIFDEQKSEST